MTQTATTAGDLEARLAAATGALGRLRADMAAAGARLAELEPVRGERDEIARRLAEKGVEAGADQVVLVDSAA